MEPKFTPKIETPQSSTENLSETKEKIHEMYYTRQPQSDFSKMGDLKLIDGKIFFVDKHSHQTREHGNSRDILIVLNNQMKELFRFDGERHMEFDNIETKRSDKNWSKPENQFVAQSIADSVIWQLPIKTKGAQWYGSSNTRS